MKVEFIEGEVDKLLATFGDSERIVDWARKAIASCIKEELVSGRNEKRIEPKHNITRAEVAVIVRLLLQKSNLIN